MPSPYPRDQGRDNGVENVSPGVKRRSDPKGRQNENSMPNSGAKSGAFLVSPKPLLSLIVTFLVNAYCTSPMIDCSSCSPSNASTTRQSGESRLTYSIPYSPNSNLPSPLVYAI